MNALIGSSALNTLNLVHRNNGVIIPVHPFRRSAPSLGNKVFDIHGFYGIEVLNGNSSDEQNQMAKEAALKLTSLLLVEAMRILVRTWEDVTLFEDERNI